MSAIILWSFVSGGRGCLCVNLAGMMMITLGLAIMDGRVLRLFLKRPDAA